MPKGNCEDCGTANPRVGLGGIDLCDRCADRRIAQITGFPELPGPPPPFVVRGADGRPHELVPRLWRAPTGIELELEEAGVPAGEGYHLAVLGAHDADVGELFDHLRRRAEVEVGRQYLERRPDGAGWHLEGAEVAGRLVWGDARELGGPYDVVVDGQTLTWDALGRALEAYEGWSFQLVIDDRHLEDLRPDGDVISFAPMAKHAGEEEQIVPDVSDIPSPTIEEVFAEFLAEQEKRLAPRTFRSYSEVIELLGHCLNNYGHQSLNDAERRRWEGRYDQDEAAFTRLFGPDKIAENLGEFLGYFMIHKVMAGEELMRAAGTVTKKLAQWLGHQSYLDTDAVEIAVERGGDAARDLPKAEKLSNLLHQHARRTTIDTDALDEHDYVEDYLMIERVEPGQLWFEGSIGPVAVPNTASALAQPGWSVNIVLGRQGNTWHIIEVGNVYP
ncbi:MAG: DUF7713 domain-containing protein [Acidimicrobiia bacterium]